MDSSLIIDQIKARQIFDSRGKPTLEVETFVEKQIARAAVPSGASTGAYEAFELRDKDEKSYNGLGVLMAVTNINTTIKKRLLSENTDIFDQAAVDDLLIIHQYCR